ncbi:daptide biosynthesis RiPP recognition protein [Microbacterium sp. NPDC090218]
MQFSSFAASRGSHDAVAAFEQYVSGRRIIFGRASFFLESAEHLDDVRALAEPEDVIFAPAGAAPRVDPRIIRYEGALLEFGDEMLLDGGHTFELQDYLAAPFFPAVGLTIVRQGSAEGLAAFLRDADTARESGPFVEQARTGTVLLESEASFTGADPAADSLVRVHVNAQGECRDGPDGLLLGHVGDARADIEAVAAEGAGRGRAFARIVDPRVLEADLDDRPWIERYVATLDLLRKWDGTPPRSNEASRWRRSAAPEIREHRGAPTAAGFDVFASRRGGA